MSVNQALGRFLVLIAVFTVIQIALQMPYLPSPIAVRFDAAGAAVTWSSAQRFATINVMIVALIVTAFLFLPGMLSRRQRPKWRLPNRDYWLAPDRLPTTIEYLQRQFLWYGIVTLLMLMAVFQLVVAANRVQPATLNVRTLGWLLASYIAFIIVWAWSLWRKFARPPPAQRENPFD